MPSVSPLAHILVVEDEPAVAGLITTTLNLANYQVTVAQSAAQALACVGQQRFDLALIDWMMPQVSGVVLAKQLRAVPATRDLPIILLTARADESDKITGLEAGADDYVTKPFSPRELLARVQALLRRAQPLRASSVLSFGPLRLDPAEVKAWVQLDDSLGGTVGDTTESPSPTPLAVSLTEFKLLHCLMLRPERIHTRAALLAMAWSEAERVDERTVDAHVKGLRRALADAGCPPVIETQRGVGYRLVAA